MSLNTEDRLRQERDEWARAARALQHQVRELDASLRALQAVNEKADRYCRKCDSELPKAKFTKW